MKIALIKETKTPVDNRVALAPKQVAELNRQFPQHQIVVQASDIRAFSDNEYRAEGVGVLNDVSDADILFGIKEAKIESLIPNKHYFFFGHIAKMQEYNRPLLGHPCLCLRLVGWRSGCILHLAWLWLETQTL